MLRKRKSIFRLITLMLAMALTCSATAMLHPHRNWSEMSSALPTLSQVGSRGSQVRKIQEKLQNAGYYQGNLDGIFGTQTRQAVVRFQRDHGLAPDGIVGPATLEALGLASSVANLGAGSAYSSRDVELLANIISAEARGEPYHGQVAVGAVVLNRVEHPSFPDSIAGVVYQPGAFTAVTDGQINEPVAESARQAAIDALSGMDPSGGAIYYYNPVKTSNKWMRSRPVIATIGAHLFCS